MNALRRLLCVLAVFALSSAEALLAAEFKLAAVFGEHMVLQREKPVAVWGWAEPDDRVSVEFAGQAVAAAAAADGRWLVKLAAMPASAEPRTLVARCTRTGQQIEVADVLVGEVWLGSGQSNMAMLVRNAQNFEQEQAAARLPLVRMFKEDSRAAATPQIDGHGSWTVCAPETVGLYSATLYFMGRELHRELQVPVGLLYSSVGGTPIESWIAQDVQANTPELKAAVAADLDTRAKFDEAAVKENYEKALDAWKQRVAKAKAAGQSAPRRPRDPAETHHRRGEPGGLFNAKINPLIPYTVRGMIWYQGEGNAHPEKAHLYQYQLPLLVSDWRNRWGEELPFAWVQLPNFQRPGEGWMLVREAMLKTLRLPHTGMAITIDIGESKQIHPVNKQEVGRRLALWALGDVYGRSVPATSGPLPAGHERRGNAIAVTFTYADGLRAKAGEAQGFTIAGADRQFKPATVRVEGNHVIVSAGDVAEPVAVRYAWEPDPQCNLVNGAGLPASPFRTDAWEPPAN